MAEESQPRKLSPLEEQFYISPEYKNILKKQKDAEYAEDKWYEGVKRRKLKKKRINGGVLLLIAILFIALAVYLTQLDDKKNTLIDWVGYWCGAIGFYVAYLAWYTVYGKEY